MKLHLLSADENKVCYLVVQSTCRDDASQADALKDGVLWRLECGLRPDANDEVAYSQWEEESDAAEIELKARIENEIRPLLTQLNSNFIIELGYENWDEDMERQKHWAECFAIITAEKSKS